MQWLKTALFEIYGLFVDDAFFAAAILGWLGLVWLLVRMFPSHHALPALLLFAGLAAILMESATRSARSRRRKMRE